MARVTTADVIFSEYLRNTLSLGLENKLGVVAASYVEWAKLDSDSDEAYQALAHYKTHVNAALSMEDGGSNA